MLGFANKLGVPGLKQAEITPREPEIG